ncbi:MAG: ECF transporter S component [Synergistaceae bacterium]|jgi:uncharacterized membrane protein|nr:ECF transporter S component [Synergistaceae bacterium]
MNRIDGTKTGLREFVTASIFTGLIFLLAFITPLGFIPLGGINATTIHIPVIVGSLTLGPYWGAFLGAVFGITSFIKNSFMPNLTSFVFSPMIPLPGTSSGSLWALVVCFVPRILIGVTPWYVNKLLRSFSPLKEKLLLSMLPLFAAGIAGSATNTLLVMHIIYFAFKDSYAAAAAQNTAYAAYTASGAIYDLILFIIMTNGIPEAIVAGVLTSSICKAIEAYRKGRN